jgi:hypothetical protein
MNHNLLKITKEFLRQYADEVGYLSFYTCINVNVRKGNSKMFFIIGYKDISHKEIRMLDLSDCDLSQCYIHVKDVDNCTLLNSKLERQIEDFRYFDSNKIEEVLIQFLTKFEFTKRYVVIINNKEYVSSDSIEECKSLYNQILEYINVSYVQSAYIVDTESTEWFTECIELYNKQIKPFKTVI